MARCRHKHTEQTTMREKNEAGQVVPFVRFTCADCGRWISDQPRRPSRLRQVPRLRFKGKELDRVVDLVARVMGDRDNPPEFEEPDGDDPDGENEGGCQSRVKD